MHYTHLFVGPGQALTQLSLTKEEYEHGQLELTGFLVEGIKIQEIQ